MQNNTDQLNYQISTDEEFLHALLSKESYHEVVLVRQSNVFIIVALLVAIAALLSILVDKANLNRVGIILKFLAAFMVTPEILGTTNLKKASHSLKIHLIRYQNIISFNRKTSWMRNFTVLSCFVMFLSYSLILFSASKLNNSYPWYLTAIAPYAIIYSTLMLFITIATYFTGLLTYHVLIAVTRDDLMRSRLIYWGAILFVISALLQFMATF